MKIQSAHIDIMVQYENTKLPVRGSVPGSGSRTGSLVRRNFEKGGSGSFGFVSTKTCKNLKKYIYIHFMKHELKLECSIVP